MVGKGSNEWEDAEGGGRHRPGHHRHHHHRHHEQHSEDENNEHRHQRHERRRAGPKVGDHGTRGDTKAGHAKIAVDANTAEPHFSFHFKEPSSPALLDSTISSEVAVCSTLHRNDLIREDMLERAVSAYLHQCHDPGRQQPHPIDEDNNEHRHKRQERTRAGSKVADAKAGHDDDVSEFHKDSLGAHIVPDSTKTDKSSEAPMGDGSLIPFSESDDAPLISLQGKPCVNCKNKRSRIDNENVRRSRGRRTAINVHSVGVGDIAPDFELEDGMGMRHRLSSYKGRKILLSFFRFAACHTCLYNIDMMKRQYDMLRKAGILIICIFKSTPENISRFASEHLGDDMLALSDKKGSVYKSYQVKKSSKNIYLGPVKTMKQWEKFKPYFDKGIMSIMKDATVSAIKLLPADLLIDEDGIIFDVYRAEHPDSTPQMPFERIEAFIPEGKRCKCNKRDCISPRCRKNYNEQIGKENVILTGMKRSCNRRAGIQA